MTCCNRIATCSDGAGDARTQVFLNNSNRCEMCEMRMLCSGIRKALLCPGKLTDFPLL